MKLQDLLDYCITHGDEIFVHCEFRGVMGNHALSTLPAKLVLAYIQAWGDSGFTPVRVVHPKDRREPLED